VAQELSEVTEGLSTLNDALNSLNGLGGSIAQVMGPGGFPPSIAERVPEVQLDRVPQVESGHGHSPVLSVLSSRRPAPAVLPLPSFLLAPLGLTCVWNVATDGWHGGENIFGDPPSDGTFFELYTTDGFGRPQEPLAPLAGSAFSSVRLLSQRSVFDIETVTRQSGQTVLDVRTQGTASSFDIWDVAIRDGMLSSGTTVLDFNVDLSPTVFQGSGTVRDIFISETLTAGASDGTLVVEVRKTGDGAQTILFTIQFGLQAPFPITSGSVTIDGATVASVSGSSLGAPVITVTDDRFPTSQRVLLGDIFGDSDQLALELFDVTLFGACIGAEDIAVNSATGESAFCDFLVSPAG
jgi:hypothetical protein